MQRGLGHRARRTGQRGCWEAARQGPGRARPCAQGHALRPPRPLGASSSFPVGGAGAAVIESVLVYSQSRATIANFRMCLSPCKDTCVHGRRLLVPDCLSWRVARRLL